MFILLLLMACFFTTLHGYERNVCNNRMHRYFYDDDIPDEELTVTVDSIVNRTGNGASFYCRGQVQRQLDEYRHSLQAGSHPDEHLHFTSQCTNDTLSINSTVSREGDICYVILAHKDLEMLLRVINKLNESFSFFVIHVDQQSPVLFSALKYMYGEAGGGSNVHLLPFELRQNISWGGFSVVNATIQSYRYALIQHTFDWIVELSESSYPLRGSGYIRQQLIQSSYLGFIDINKEAFSPEVFFHFIECEKQLYLIRKKSLDIGIKQYIGSQFKIIHRSIARWLVYDKLAISYRDYAENIIISDENYFSTTLQNSPFCHLIEKRSNKLFVIFHQFDTIFPNNNNKCLVPHASCGRSPRILEINSTYGSMLLRIIQRNDDRYFFARKFDSSIPNSLLLADYIDSKRLV